MRQGSRQKLIDDLREHVKNAVPFSLTFSPCGDMSNEQRKVLEDHLRESFRCWASSWITPYINEIEKRWLKPKRNKK